MPVSLRPLRTPVSYRAALRSARAAALLAPYATPRVAATVRENLRLVYGEADPLLVRAIYAHFGAAFVDLLFFNRLFDPERIEEHFPFSGDGLEHYRATKPPAAVFATGHFGNWELYGAAFQHMGITVSPVAREQDGRFAKWLDGFRARQGQTTIDKKNALPLALKALKAGRCVAFLIDQAAGRHGIPVPFLGQTAYTFTAPAALAIKLDLPLYAGYATRIGDGVRYRCFSETVSTDGGVEETTLRLNRRLESYVAAAPEQWWWFHRRFKPPRSQRRGKKVSPAGVPVTEGAE